MNIILSVILWLAYLTSLYFSIFWILVFVDSGISLKKREGNIHLKNFPYVSIIIPAHNEEDVIASTLKSVAALEYPKEKYEVIVVNDGSTDNTEQVVQSSIENNQSTAIKLINQANKGKAAALNNALDHTKGEFFACLDADSEVDPLTLRKMLAVYEENDQDLVIVTPAMKVKKPKSLMERFQWLEYLVSLLVARLMSHLDCIYVAPGPFSLYRTSTVKSLGGFEESNLTEDMEIAYRVQKHHFKIKHCHDAHVYTAAPPSFKGLYKQRNRWFKGGILNALKYRKLLLNRRYGDFGMVQMSVNMMAFFLCAVTLFFFSYYLLLPLIKSAYNLYLVNFDIWPYLRNISFKFQLLGIDITKMLILLTLLAMAAVLFYLSHKSSNEKLTKHGVFYIVPYFLVYYLILSFIAIMALFEAMVGKRQKW